MAYAQSNQRDLDRRASPHDPQRVNAPTGRTRASSNASTARNDTSMQDHARLRPQVPINEAVVSAFDKAETANHVPPELIAQITESVIKQLKSSGIESSSTPVPQTNTHPPPPVQQSAPQSPSTMSGCSPQLGSRNVYTPPSPQKHTHYPNGSPVASNQTFPPPQSPTRDSASVHHDRRTSSPLSQDSEITRSPTRPKGPERLGTENNETTLEKIWGPLFDEQGNATKRLGQLLRGLAIRIIEDYEPRHSIVITPAKLIKYYEDVKLPKERYPWSIVFDDEQSSISRMFRELECSHHLIQERPNERPDIPGLTPVGFQQWVTYLLLAHPEEEYQRLCKAVLSMPISNPDDKKERFPKELSRRLFPNHEDRATQDRLEDAMTEHCHVDFPRRGSQESMSSHKPSMADSQTSNASHRPNAAPSVDYPSASRKIERERAPYAGTPFAGTAAENPSVYDNHTPAPSGGHRPNIAPEIQPGTSSNLERERKPYSSIPNESAIEDTNPPSTSKPIERERKPYSSNPGGNKFFDDELRDSTRAPPPPQSRPNDPSFGTSGAPPPTTNGMHRAESIAGRSGPGGPTPRANPPTGRPRPMSIHGGNYQRPPPPSATQGFDNMSSSHHQQGMKPEIHQYTNNNNNPHHHARRASNAGIGGAGRPRHRSPSFSRTRDGYLRGVVGDAEFHSQRYNTPTAGGGGGGGPAAFTQGLGVGMGAIPPPLSSNGFDTDSRYARERDRLRRPPPPDDFSDGKGFGSSPATRPRPAYGSDAGRGAAPPPPGPPPSLGGSSGPPPPPPLSTMDFNGSAGAPSRGGGNYIPDEDFYRSAGRPIGNVNGYTAGGDEGGGGGGGVYGGPMY